MSGTSPTPPANGAGAAHGYADLPPGAAVAGFRVESGLGAGAMGAVYRAHELALGRTVALKVLPPALAWDERFRERFIRESRLASAVDHPNIIPIYAAGNDADFLYLAMRYVPGGDLYALLRELGPLSPEQAMSVLAPIAAALDAAHRAGVVHRDLKPANILVDRAADGAVHPYLSDFGLAMTSEMPRMTATGLFLGTAAYAAPEQLTGKAVGPPSDQYALACVAFQILTGEMPFRGDNPPAQMVARMDGVPRPTEVRPDLPSGVDSVLGRAMAQDPGERYGSCRELAEALADVLGPDARDASEVHLGVELRVGERTYRGRGRLHPDPEGQFASAVPTYKSPDPVAGQGPRRRRRLMVAGGAVAVALVVAGLGAAMAFSPRHDGAARGRTVAAATPHVSAAPKTARIRSTGPVVLDETLHVPGRHAVTAARFRPQDGGIAVVDAGGSVTGWEAQQWHQIEHVTLMPADGARLRLSAARFARADLAVVVPSAACSRAATSCAYDPFDTTTGKPWAPVTGGTGPVLSFANQLMAVATPAHDAVDIWDAAKHQQHDAGLGRSSDRVRSVALDPTGAAMAVGVSTPAGGTSVKWFTDVLHPQGRTPRVVATVPTTTAGPRIALTGQSLAVGGERRTDLYRAMPSRPDQRRLAHVDGSLMALSPANGNLVATRDGNRVKLWDDTALLPTTWPAGARPDRTRRLTPSATMTCAAATPTTVAFSADDHSAAVGCSDGTLTIWTLGNL